MSAFRGTGVIHLDSSDFENGVLIFEGMPAQGSWICMVQGEFCHYCTEAKPEFLKAMKMVGDKTTFCTLQIDGGEKESKANQMLKNKMQYKGVPSFVLFKNGRPVALHQGGRDASSISKFARQ